MARQFFYWMNVLTTVHVNPTIRESTITVLNNVSHCCQKKKNFKIKSETNSQLLMHERNKTAGL